MSPMKLITVIVLLVVAAHLLLFGFLKRRIAEAVREKERLDREE